MNESETPPRLFCLACLVLVASLLSCVDPVTVSANVAAPVPGALWTVPMPTAGSPVVIPTGNVLAGPCTNVNRNGSVIWSLPDNLETSASCATAIGDNQGNSYIQTTDSTGEVVESINSSGGIRWTMPMGSFGPGGSGVGPAIGSNGSVYFSEYSGSGSKVVGFDEQTGAVTFTQPFVQVTGLYAYAGGLIVVNTDSEVDYFSYDGSSEITYHTSPAISAGQAYSNAAGANGTVYLAGYPGGCGGNVSVAKFTPTGPAWTWTDSTAHNCNQTLLAASPDGGVILARSEAASGLSADFTSVSPTGTFRWDHHANGPLGPAYGGGFLRPIVDVNGLVALPSIFESTCPEAGQCKGAQVEFVSQQTNSPILPTVEVTDPVNGGFDLYGTATDSERLYLSREYQGATVPPSLSAFAVPGLGVDYRLALQEALLPVAPVPPSSGGSSPTSGGGSQPSPGSSSPPAGYGCPAYIVIDSRGTGEAVGTTSPPGAAFAAEFARQHRGARVAVLRNPYPAVSLWGSVRALINLVGAGLGIGPLGAYHASVVDGEKWLRREIGSEISACNTTKLLLTGYSQGAQVTGDVYQRYVSTALRKHIIAVALFGDPYFNPSDTAADRGSLPHNRIGVLGRRRSFGGDRRVISYCHYHDPVCQHSNIAEALIYRLTQHKNYPPDAVAAAKHF